MTSSEYARGLCDGCLAGARTAAHMALKEGERPDGSIDVIAALDTLAIALTDVAYQLQEETA